VPALIFLYRSHSYIYLCREAHFFSQQQKPSKEKAWGDDILPSLSLSLSLSLPRRQLFDVFLGYNDGGIICFILCNQKKKRKVRLAVALALFVFSDARVMMILLRRALF